MIKKYNIIIEETISEMFEVSAESEEQAKTIAIKKYKSGEFVLQPGNLIYKQMQIRNSIDNTTDWIEF